MAVGAMARCRAAPPSGGGHAIEAVFWHPGGMVKQPQQTHLPCKSVAASTKVKEYLGAARFAEARDEAVRRCEAYYGRMAEEFARMRRAASASMPSGRQADGAPPGAGGAMVK